MVEYEKNDDLQHERRSINQAVASYVRGGDFLMRVFQKESKNLSGEECLQLMNTYGLPSGCIFLLAISHDFVIDSSKFLSLIAEQKEKSRRCIKCTEETDEPCR